MKYGIEKTLYTGGTFDLFHAGHVRFLKHCKKLCGRVVVCLNTDDFIERFKGSKPIICYQERAEVLMACAYVDGVIPNSGGEDSKPTILQSGASVVAIGEDWATRDYFKQMQIDHDFLNKHNITLVYISIDKTQSSTNIKKSCESNPI